MQAVPNQNNKDSNPINQDEEDKKEEQKTTLIHRRFMDKATMYRNYQNYINKRKLSVRRTRNDIRSDKKKDNNDNKLNTIAEDEMESQVDSLDANSYQIRS